MSVTYAMFGDKDDRVRRIFEASANRFVSVVFTKKDGTTRRMLGRVSSPGGVTERYIRLFDVQLGEWRTVNFSRVHRIRARKAEYVFAPVTGGSRDWHVGKVTYHDKIIAA